MCLRHICLNTHERSPSRVSKWPSHSCILLTLAAWCCIEMYSYKIYTQSNLIVNKIYHNFLSKFLTAINI